MDNLILLAILPFSGCRFLPDHAGPRLLRLRVKELQDKLWMQRREFGNAKYELMAEKYQLETDMSRLRKKMFENQCKLLEYEEEICNLTYIEYRKRTASE